MLAQRARPVTPHEEKLAISTTIPTWSLYGESFVPAAVLTCTSISYGVHSAAVTTTLVQTGAAPLQGPLRLGP